MSTIAFLGTGLLGGAFAEAAAKRGDTVSAWNRSPDKAQALTAFGVRASASAADAVRGAGRVHLILKDDAVVDEVIAAARPGLDAGAVIIDHTTNLPELTAARCQRLRAEGVAYLHCPVFMGPAAARGAQGSMIVSGDRALFERVREALARMTGQLEFLGERDDLAAVNKLLGNATLIGVAAVLADVLTIAKSGGVSGDDALRLLAMLNLNATVANRGAAMSRGDFDSPSFELSMARKDVGLMLQAAGQRPLAALPGIATRMQVLIAQGHGAKDSNVIGLDATR